MKEIKIKPRDPNSKVKSFWKDDQGSHYREDVTEEDHKEDLREFVKVVNESEAHIDKLKPSVKIPL